MFVCLFEWPTITGLPLDHPPSTTVSQLFLFQEVGGSSYIIFHYSYIQHVIREAISRKISPILGRLGGASDPIPTSLTDFWEQIG